MAELDEQDVFISLRDMFGCDAKSLPGAPLTWAKVVEFLRSQGSALASLDDYHLAALIKILINNTHLALDFIPGRFQGSLLLFTATIDQPEDLPAPDTWRSYVDGEIETHAIPRNHRSRSITTPGALSHDQPLRKPRQHLSRAD